MLQEKASRAQPAGAGRRNLRRDDPGALADRAIREADAALRRKDDVGFREAAEKGWLAASSSANIAADKLGYGGADELDDTGRKWALGELEDRARLRRGTLVGTFEAARAVLHGEYVCSTRGVLGLLDDVKSFTASTQAAINKATRRQRQR
jgi:hypothetical protein